MVCSLDFTPCEVPQIENKSVRKQNWKKGDKVTQRDGEREVKNQNVKKGKVKERDRDRESERIKNQVV